MLSLKNGTIQVADDKIVLVIKKDDCEEFKKYKNVDKSGAIIDDKFYVGCTLNDQQLYITGSYPQEELGDNTIMNVKSVGKKGGKYFSRLEEMKNLLGLNDGKEEIMVKALSCHPTVQLLEEKNVKTTELEAAEEQLKGKNEELEAAKKKAEEELRTKTQELQDQLDTAQQEKQDLEAEVEKLKAIDSTALQQQLEEKNVKTTELEAAEEQLKGKNEELEAAKKKAEEELRTKTQELQDQLDTAQQEKQDLEAEVEKLKAIDSTALQQQLEEKNAKITELEALDAVALQQKLTEKENEITALKAQPDAAVTKLEGEKTTLTNKIKDLEAQLNNQPNAAQLKDKEDKIKELEAKINQPNAEVESLKKDLQARNARVHQLEKENKELEAKNKTTEQPKQGNAALYTATAGMGLAAGLIAFTALERTVRLEMLVMIGIAVASALVVGGITYAALPSTQVDGAKAQEVNENGKGK